MPPIDPKFDDEATAKRAAITTGSGPNPARPAEEVLVSVRRVSCDGIGGALGHPRVYIELGEDGVAECGYCDRRFVLVGHERPESDRLAPGVYEGSSGH
jgi:uncharacterized Zn-finger protein